METEKGEDHGHSVPMQLFLEVNNVLLSWTINNKLKVTRMVETAKYADRCHLYTLPELPSRVSV